MKINLEQLIQALILKGKNIEKASPPSKGPSVPTSIRLKPLTKLFLESQAEALNTSMQSLISTILDGVAETTLNNPSRIVRTIRERFFFLFEAHDIDFPGIVSVLKNYGFTLSVLEDPIRLVDHLKQDVIEHLANTFFVRPNWVSGADDRVIELGTNVRWYKNVATSGRKLLTYAELDMKPHVFFIRRRHADFERARTNNDVHSDSSLYEPVGLVVRLERKTDDGFSFATYEVWQFERWNYWRCRHELKLLIAFCDQTSGRVRFSGYELPEDEIQNLCAGRVMPSKMMDRLGQVAWHPYDYATTKHEVTKEADEWQSVHEDYLKGPYEKIIKEWYQDRLQAI
ncbi:hypothetical protein [Polynucleobacter sp. Fuers-14]|uniref:hypothetical protein n=1 Tax=Polynucleobacter sp. Fuers-14 TaxID=1758364 RepID=UPI001C0B89AB|nr:hypothetical protein [Polynucleobacter sp. Fuers-14]MBU3640991.1 hypothetical protein [Polynucleobacter sp. Fuers-14]